MRLALAIGVWPLGAISFARRASAPLHGGETGAALGAVVGAWAGVLAGLWCPAVDPSHLIVGHVAPIALLALVGVGLGRQVIAVRGRAARVALSPRLSWPPGPDRS